MQVVRAVDESLLLALGTAWQVGWSLILGFALSAAVQALVSKERMQHLLGRAGIRKSLLRRALALRVRLVRTLQRR